MNLRLKKPFSLALLFIFLLPISLSAYECHIKLDAQNDSSVPSKEIETEIHSYLSSNSLSPALFNSDRTYEIKAIFEDSGVVYTLGELSDGQSNLITLFSIDKGWVWTTTKMLYMTTDIDSPSPVLFTDICQGARNALPNHLSNYHVLIRKLEDSDFPAGTQVQLWSFFNLGEWLDLIIVSFPTPDGGSDFCIMVPNQ